MTHGETNLSTLLATLSPELQSDHYVFLTFPDARYGEHQSLEPIASFAEPEGLTLVVKQSMADGMGLQYETSFALITLCVHSSLTAVGLTALFATQLSEAGISANVFAGFYHDHILVPYYQANDALDTLLQIGRDYKKEGIDFPEHT